MKTQWEISAQLELFSIIIISILLCSCWQILPDSTTQSSVIVSSKSQTLISSLAFVSSQSSVFSSSSSSSSVKASPAIIIETNYRNGNLLTISGKVTGVDISNNILLTYLGPISNGDIYNTPNARDIYKNYRLSPYQGISLISNGNFKLIYISAYSNESIIGFVIYPVGKTPALNFFVADFLIDSIFYSAYTTYNFLPVDFPYQNNLLPGNAGIVIDNTTLINTTSDIEGHVTGVKPGDAFIVFCIRVGQPNNWWIKPNTDHPKTIIAADGRFYCDVTTGGLDTNASSIVAYLFTNNYTVKFDPGGLIYNYMGEMDSQCAVKKVVR